MIQFDFSNTTTQFLFASFDYFNHVTEWQKHQLKVFKIGCQEINVYKNESKIVASSVHLNKQGMACGCQHLCVMGTFFSNRHLIMPTTVMPKLCHGDHNTITFIFFFSLKTRMWHGFVLYIMLTFVKCPPCLPFLLAGSYSGSHSEAAH